MTRRDLLWRSGLGILGAGAASRAQDTGKLNFVFFLIDDLGWADLGCYGNQFHETPSLDRLAAQGMRFTNAYASCPVCSPTRASILTGKYPARLGITYVIQHPRFRDRRLLPPEIPRALPLSEVTIPEALRSAGYVSACVGKWHLGGEGLYPEYQGFDVNIGGTHIGMLNSHFYPGWSRGPGGPENAKAALPLDGRPGEYMTDHLAGKAVEFVEANRNRPFFLYLSHYAVHTPIEGKEDMVAKYRGKHRGPQQNPIYAALVESVDQSVGRVLRKLDELGIADRTVIFFTSDNGGLTSREGPDTPPTTNAPLRDGKKYLWEGGIRVPLIVRWPGVARPGSVCGVPVISNDHYPTIVEMSGVRKDPGNPDGESLTPLLKGRGRLRREALYWHVPHYNRPGAAIRKGDYKLIEFFDPPGLELYNLKEDIGETQNLAEKLPAKVAELKRALNDWQGSVGAKMMVPNPDYRPEAGKGPGE